MQKGQIDHILHLVQHTVVIDVLQWQCLVWIHLERDDFLFGSSGVFATVGLNIILLLVLRNLYNAFGIILILVFNHTRRYPTMFL